MSKIVFLDRDGVINRFPGHGLYVTKVKDFHLLPGSLEAIRLLTEAGCSIFVVSNQAGVSKGVYSRNKLERINRKMMSAVKKSGGKIKRTFYCIHRPTDNCNCRKPRTGSLEKAFRILKRSPKKKTDAFFVGDTQNDIIAGKNAGCTTISVLSGKDDRRALRKWKVQPEYITKDLLDATKIILGKDRGKK